MGKSLPLTLELGSLLGSLSLLALLVLVGQPLAQHQGQSPGVDEERAQLLTLLRDEQLREHEPERVAKAIERIGDLRSVDDIEDLIKLLTFSRNIQKEIIGDTIVGEHFITPFARYPAAGALFRIGKPSLPGLMGVIRTEDTASLASENALYTLMQIFRDAPSQGVEYLKEAATGEPSPEAARGLSIAAEKMKRFVHQ